LSRWAREKPRNHARLFFVRLFREQSDELKLRRGSAASLFGLVHKFCGSNSILTLARPATTLVANAELDRRSACLIVLEAAGCAALYSVHIPRFISLCHTGFFYPFRFIGLPIRVSCGKLLAFFLKVSHHLKPLRTATGIAF